MADEMLTRLAVLLRERNAIDAQIAAVIGRPMTAGHLGEYIASRVFGIDLEASATSTAIDGRFRDGPLEGRTVNIKWYLKREGALDMTASALLDYYLVLTGPSSSIMSSRNGTRPWIITHAYLFDARELASDLQERGRHVGVASSVRNHVWEAAEVFPRSHPLLPLRPEQRESLEMFAP